jgi:drug/metabolite transporter (DMT)-like permease
MRFKPHQPTEKTRQQAQSASGLGLPQDQIAALIGIAEPVLGPLWVWLIHQETPRAATLWGGGVVFVALLAHVLWQLREAPATET